MHEAVDIPAADIPAYARRVLPGGVPWNRYVAVGDSTIEGLGETVEGFPPGGWPKRLADGLRAVNPELEFFNLGERYLTARQVRETQLAKALELKPDLVTMFAGGNDMLTKTFEPEKVEAELEVMVSELLAAGATVYICTMWDAPSVEGVLPDEAKEFLRDRFYPFNDRLRAIADRHAADPGFVFDDMARCDAARDASNYSSDCQHLNSRGFALMAAGVLDRLAAHLHGRTIVADAAAQAEPAGTGAH